MEKRRYLEIFIFEIILWFGLWLVNDYLATLLTVILTAILIAILLISVISEAIERSKVPKSYFIVMAISIAASILAALLYMVILGRILWFLN
jgi:hypothetical protein